MWDRVDPVVYNYCDSLERDCSKTANWLPNFLTISPLQGIGALPLVLSDGSLGVIYDSITAAPIAVPGDEPEIEPGSDQIQFALAPAAGSVPWPAPLTFTQTTIPVASNQSNGTRYQRASEGLPTADVDPITGAIYVGWDDGRLRTEADSPVNDVVITKSTDGGLTWGPVTRVNPGPTNDFVNRYNVALDAADGTLHIAYHQRQEAADPLGSGMSRFIDTYYQESRNGGTSFSTPLRVDRQRTNFFYGAFSRGGLFEGDYNQVATAGGLTYIVREAAYPLSSKEPPGLVYNAADDNYVGDTSECPNANGTPVITSGCLRHLHQRTWVAVVRSP